MNKIVIKNREPQEIKIGGGGAVIGVTEVLVNGVDVTQGSIAYVVVPTKTSELDNDSGFITQETDPTIPYYIKQITQADINSWNNKQDQLISGNNIKTINGNSIMGSGNLDIDTSYTAGTGININEENVISNTITSYNDLTDLPTIPTKTSDLFNDSDYVTSSELSEVATSGDYDDLTNKPTIPTQTSELENDSGYITNRVDNLINYYDKDFLYNLLPKVSDTGSNITLDNTYKSKLELTLSPSTLEQETTTGKNLIDYITNLKTSNAGMTSVINADGSITTTGKPSYNYANILSIDITPILQNGGKYTLWQETAQFNILYLQITGIHKETSARVYYTLADRTKITFTADTTNYTYGLTIQAGTTVGWGDSSRTITNYYMLEKADDKTSFEPYTGGIPAPNPSYPQDIHTISGSNTIKVEGKNLFEPTANSQTLASGGTLTKNNDNTYTVSNGRTDFADLVILGTINVVNGKTYYLYNAFNDNNNNLSLRRGSTMIVATSTNNVVSYTATATETLNVYIRYQSTGTFTFTPMVAYSSPTSYTPYTLETKDIDLGDIEYCKIGDYEDRIFKNVEGDPDYDESLEVGTWYLKQEIGKVVLDGSENWNYVQSGTKSILYRSIEGKITSKAGLFSNYFIYSSSAWQMINDNYMCEETGNNSIFIRDDSIASANDFKTWLGTHNMNLYYVLATPTYTPITGTLEDQLNSLQSAYSENEQTNISQINNDLPFQITATTLKDISNL